MKKIGLVQISPQEYEITLAKNYFAYLTIKGNFYLYATNQNFYRYE